MSSFFVELSLVMLIALLVSFVFHKLKQPLLVGYIITGILAGPLFFNILSSTEGYETFSHIGVALLLFIVGLHLNLKLIKEIGFVAFAAGSAQIIFTALIGYFICIFLGFSSLTSFIVGIGLSFSSTIVIVKLLSDKKEIERVHGKLAMGILIIQDLVAVVMLMVLASFVNASGGNLIYSLLKIFFLGLLAMFGVLIFSKVVLERLLDWIADSQEFLFIFILSWCLGVSALFAYMGFSVEIGALLAGVALASSPYQYEISSRIKPLRDFFIIMFFILLGSQMVPVENIPNVVSYTSNNLIDIATTFTNNYINKVSYLFESFAVIFLPALLISVFVLIIKPLIIYIVLNLLGFHSRVSFLTGASLAQISEFSLIMIMIAHQLELVGLEEVSLLTLVGIITILFSTYFMTHSLKFYKLTKPILDFLTFRTPIRGLEKEISKDSDVLIFGYDRIGFSLLKTIAKLGKSYEIVDYNPNVIRKLDEKGIPCVYGDASDNDFVNEFNLEGLSLLISTIPDLEVNVSIIKQFRKRNRDATIILTADHIDNALELYKEGADYVILPHFLGGDYISNLVERHNNNLNDFLHEKIQHINQLKERKEFGFDYAKKA